MQFCVLRSLLPSVNLAVLSHIRHERLPHRVIEYPDIKVFSVDPGSVQTDMFDKFGGPIPPNSTAGLAASTIQYVTSGKADYLSGRFVSSTWDLGEVERDWKEKIIAQRSLVSKLSIPV